MKNEGNLRRVAILCVGFIRYDFHALFAMRTAVAIAQQETRHTLDPILVVNHLRSEPNDLEALSPYFPTVILNDQNNLARAWNRGIGEAFHRGADYCLILNMDVIIPQVFVENIVAFAESAPHYLVWSGVEWPSQESIENAPCLGTRDNHIHFSCFMIDKRFPRTIGSFDEQFGPAYHEDSDVFYRIRLLGLPFGGSHTAPFFHLDRVSLKGAVLNEDHSFLDELRVAMDESMKRYEIKWGGLPGQESFKTPYNK